MPIGIVSEDDFMKEMESYGKTTKGSGHVQKAEVVHEVIPKRGRKEGDVNVPDSIRQIIAEESVINGRSNALQLGKELGVSASSVSAYAVGATSTKSYNEPKKSILDHINKSKERAVKRASKVLGSALGSITQEKLDYTDAKDLSGIAKDMSVIIKNLEPQKENVVQEGNKSPQFVIFAPQFRKEESFEVINVNE